MGNDKFDPYRPNPQRSQVAPKRGLPWLTDKLKERAANSEGEWRDATTETHGFKGFNARLVQRDTRTPQQKRINEHSDARAEMDDVLLIDLMSIRIRARDRKRKGRIVESWVRCAFLKRIIVRAQPSRDGLGHDAYSIAMAMLCRERVAEPDPSGRNGYRWTEAHHSIRTRAAWLIDFTKRAGEMRKLTGPQRFEVFE